MSVSIERILQTLDRAHNGPLCTQKEWNLKRIPTKVKQKLDEYRLRGTCDRENPINADDRLADEFFKAGFELAVDLGMLCQDTERVINVTGDELKDAIRRAPSELAIGEGVDRVVLRNRKPEDRIPPIIRAPLGNRLTEDIWVRVNQGIVEHREIDIFYGGTIMTIFGRPVMAGTPYETLVGRYQAQLTHEVLWRAGRMGMPTVAVSSSATAFGQLGGFGIRGGFDPATSIAIILAPGELLTAYAVLHKVVHTLNCGAHFYVGTAPMIGGYAGPPEGTALVHIANVLLQFAVHHAHMYAAQAHDVRYGGNCGREGLWVQSVATQAISRNTHLMGTDPVAQVAGPCTEMLLYESAVAMMGITASGVASVAVCRGSGSKYIDYTTPLEHKFCAEVGKRSAGMSRKQVNELAKAILPEYEGQLFDPPKGKSVRECYDLQTLQPTQEWLDTYVRIKKQLGEMGVPLEYP